MRHSCNPSSCSTSRCCSRTRPGRRPNSRARAGAASLVDAFRFGVAPSSRGHVWEQGAAWPRNMTLSAANLGPASWSEGTFLQLAFTPNRVSPMSSTTTFASDPTSESDAALLTAAFLSEDEPGLLNGEGARQAGWYESAALTDPAPDRVRASDTPSALFASAPSGISPNERRTEHTWTGGASPDSAAPSLIASVRRRPTRFGVPAA